MEFTQAQSMIARLRTAGCSALENEAAAMIESLVFQLKARIGVATAEQKAEIGIVP